MGTSPWGRAVPIHIAWFLIWVAVIAGLLFFIMHAIYVRYFAKPRAVCGRTFRRPSRPHIPERKFPGTRWWRALFHWVMAASMFTLLFTAFLPKSGRPVSLGDLSLDRGMRC